MSSRSSLKPSKIMPPEEIQRLAEGFFNEPVLRITAPGGKKRASVRVFFQDRTVIASYRYRPTRRDREILVLQKLSQAGAPVPEFLGQQGDLIFQSDVGSGRLSSEMNRQDRAGQLRYARAAFDSLWVIKQAARDTGLTQEVPPVGCSADHMAEFVSYARVLSTDLGIAPPKVDWGRVVKELVPVPRHFIKWDARAGNAALSADGRISWFDWEHAGCRHGIEDFGFLIADEFWPLGPDDALEVFARSCPGNPQVLLPHLVRFATFQVIERLHLIQRESAKKGWGHFEELQRYDYLGNVRELAVQVAGHGKALAQRDTLTKPMAEWFDIVAETLEKSDPKPSKSG